jgi:tetratricopeptide (TPR) repeat protein
MSSGRWAVLLLALSTAAVAQEPERPWAKGVAPSAQKQALEIFRQGNAALKESQWRVAAERYREALALWDHPAINYNLALALLQLDQPVETYQRLEAALRYGPAPLDADKYDQGQRYRALVDKQVARVELRCDVEGAVVKLNGEQVLTGPGSFKKMVRAGAITVVASKEGYLTNEQSPTLVGGETKVIDLPLVVAEQAVEYRRLFAAWIPFAVLGAGAALAGSGVGLHLSARNQFAQYDRGIEACVDQATGGCVPSLDLAALRTSGQGQQAGAMVLYAAGGAALAAGAVLLYINRPQPYRADVKVESALLVVPTVGRDGAGASLLLSF